MSATPVAITVSRAEWTDLYEATGFERGSVLVVQNIGDSKVYLSTSNTEPAIDSLAFQIIDPNDFLMKNDGGSFGEWARSAADEGRLSVRLF